MNLTLTKAEWEIIEHRLCLCDCLADVLTSEGQYEGKWYEVNEICSNLWAQLSREMKRDGKIEITALTDLEKELLADCIDGSTFFADWQDAVARGDMSKGKAMSWFKVAASIEKKFTTFGILNNGFPNY